MGWRGGVLSPVSVPISCPSRAVFGLFPYLVTTASKPQSPREGKYSQQLENGALGLGVSPGGWGVLGPPLPTNVGVGGSRDTPRPRYCGLQPIKAINPL